MPLALDNPEPDDYLHNPDPRRDRKNDKGGSIFTARGIANLGCLFVLAAGCMMLLYVSFVLCHPSSVINNSSSAGNDLSPSVFLVALSALFLPLGFPILSHFLTKKPSTQGGFNLGGTNATGQVPNFTGNYGLIDKDTPQSAFTKPSYMKGEQDYVLVFSDEFNVDGRSFYPGDDPFWEAVDLHYWGTVNFCLMFICFAVFLTVFV